VYSHAQNRAVPPLGFPDLQHLLGQNQDLLIHWEYIEQKWNSAQGVNSRPRMQGLALIRQLISMCTQISFPLLETDLADDGVPSSK
jgi:hypothetical protein